MLSERDASLLRELSAVDGKKQGPYTVWKYRLDRDSRVQVLWALGTRKPLLARLKDRGEGTRFRDKVRDGIVHRLGITGALSDGLVELPISSGQMEEWHRLYGTDGATLLMGDSGPEQILTLALGRKGMAKVLVKLPIGDAAAARIRHEAAFLHELEPYPWQFSTFSNVLAVEGRTCIFSVPVVERGSVQLKPEHWRALNEWKERTAKETNLGGSRFWNDLNERFRRLVVLKAHKRFGELYNLMRMTARRLDTTMPMLVGLHHGDFSLKNSGIADGMMSVWNWGLGSMEAPVGLDAIHYMAQAGIAQQGKSFKALKGALDAATPSLAALLSGYPAQLKALVTLYLLDVSSRHLELFARQESLSPKAEYLLRLWEEGLQEQFILMGHRRHRDIWLEDVFTLIPKDELYVWLNPIVEHPAETADMTIISLAMEPICQQRFLAFAEVSPRVREVRQETHTDRIHVQLEFVDGSKLELDLLHAFRYKGQEYLAISDVLEKNRVNGGGVRVPHPVHDWAYSTASHVLQGKPVPCEVRTRLVPMLADKMGHFLSFAYLHTGHAFLTDAELLDETVLSHAWHRYLAWKNIGISRLEAWLRHRTDQCRAASRSVRRSLSSSHKRGHRRGVIPLESVLPVD